MGTFLPSAAMAVLSATWLAFDPASCLAAPGDEQSPAAGPPRYEAKPWPEADELFRRDPHWVGADGAYAIDLGADRFLWLFGDTFINPEGGHARTGGVVKLIGNSVGVQRGADPSQATIEFAWRTGDDDAPAAFFPDRDGCRYWPGHGIRLGNALIVFLMKVRNIEGGLGFDVFDWDAVLVDNSDAQPRDWRLSWLDTPANDLKVIVGSASVIAEGDFVYAFSSQETEGHAIYLVRWPAAECRAGQLQNAEWWCGDAGWLAATSATSAKLSPAPQPVLRDAATEFTVHRDAPSGAYFAIQTQGFGAADIVMRQAPALVGPWSAPALVYRPPEFDKPRIMLYSGKAHPQLRGADLVVTYSTNSFDFGSLFLDGSLYYPRFVRLTRR